MIIVSQNKKTILNLDNVSSIEIDDEENNRKIYASCNNNDLVELGEYESEARAKEVLQEIEKCYLSGAMVECNGYICYEMPEK